jgi:hypothetical protein
MNLCPKIRNLKIVGPLWHPVFGTCCVDAEFQLAMDHGVYSHSLAARDKQLSYQRH